MQNTNHSRNLNRRLSNVCVLPMAVSKRCTRGVRVVFPEQEYEPVTVLVGVHLILLLRKSCSVHMLVFEIVVHRNVDNCIQLLT